MTAQHRQLILSGGIHHAFNQTSALLAPLGNNMGLPRLLFIQMPRLRRLTRRQFSCLWLTHFLGNGGPNMMSSDGLAVLRVARASSVFGSLHCQRRQTPRLAYGEYLFLRSTRMEPLPGGALAVARIVSSPNRDTFGQPDTCRRGARATGV